MYDLDSISSFISECNFVDFRRVHIDMTANDLPMARKLSGDIKICIESIEDCNFECEAGPLELCAPYVYIREFLMNFCKQVDNATQEETGEQ